MKCPKEGCDGELIYEWDVIYGVYKKCSKCDYREPDRIMDLVQTIQHYRLHETEGGLDAYYCYSNE